MRVLITGANGFLGKSFIRLSKTYEFQVSALDISFDNFDSGVDYHIGSITDKKLLEVALNGVDVVVHFAAIADIGYSISNPSRAYEINILGTNLLLEIAAKFRVRHLVFSSTLYVNGNKGGHYRISKKACEEIIEYYSLNFGLTYTILRIGSVYGPDANNFNFIYQAIKSGLEQKKIYRKGIGNELREYIHVDDVNKYVLNIIKDQLFVSQKVLLSGSEKLRVKDLLYMLSEMLGGDVEIIFDKESKYDGHYIHTPNTFSPDLISKVTLENPIDLASGLLDCICHVNKELQDDNII
jgi:UDP-glucose 4-epimerase